MPLSEAVSFSQPLKAAILFRQSRAENSGKETCCNNSTEEHEDLSKIQAAEFEVAIEEAYQRGLADGRKLEAEETRQGLEQLGQEVQGTLEAVVEERRALVPRLRELLPELLVEGVGRVLHGYEPDGSMIQRIVSELLDGFDNQDSRMRLSLNPVDLENLIRLVPDFQNWYPELSLLADGSLHRGECLLDGRFGVVDARHSAKLASLRKVFA